MEELKMLENELVPVYATSTGEKVVYGTELHAVLQSKTAYKDWSDRRFLDIDAMEGEDYEVLLKNERNPKGGRPSKEHIIKLDIAKEMAMLERNAKGKQVRRYFIEVEKRYKEQAVRPLSVLEQIQILAKGNIELKKEIDSVNRDLQEFKKDMPLLGVECQKIARAKNRKVVPLMGGKDAPAHKDNSLRGEVYRDIDNQLRREFDVETYKAIKRNQVDMAVGVIEGYQLPMALEERINLLNRQMRFA